MKKVREYSEKEKEEIVEKYEQERRSGKIGSQKEYCKREGISLSWLKKWRKNEVRRFVEVEVGEQEEKKWGEYRMGNGSGIWVEFRGGLKREEILALASILKEAERC